jgi:hypothetical protein
VKNLPNLAGILPDNARTAAAYALPRDFLNALDALCRERSESAFSSLGSIIQQMHTTKTSEEQDIIRKRYRKLQNQAKPFLTYNDSGLHIAKVRIVGIPSETERGYAEQHIEQSDRATVSTDEVERLTLLYTEHGIPMHTLRNIDEYRARYLELAGDPNAMLHLNRELERAPYDPGSAYFLDLEDFDLILGKALAHNWVLRLEKETEREFVLHAAIHKSLKGVIDDEVDRLKQQLNDPERQKWLDGAFFRSQNDGIDKRIQFIQGFDEALQPYEDSNQSYRDQGLGCTVIEYYTIVLPGDSRRAIDLGTARSLLMGGRAENRVASLFVRACQRHEKKLRDIDLLKPIEDFLDARAYTTDHPVMLWSEQGEADYRIEARMCALLAAWVQAVRRVQFVGTRKSPMYRSSSPIDQG